MQFLKPNDYSLDLMYHRKASPTYGKYLEGCGLKIFSQKNTPQFIWGKPILGMKSCFLFNSERTDIEPDIEALKKESGAKHGAVIWVPYRHIEKPDHWRSLWFPTHFRETGWTHLTDADYTKKWSQRARRAKKKFLQSGATLHRVDRATFIDAFERAKFLPLLKKEYITYYKKLTAIDPESVRQWLVYSTDSKPIAGLAVHDFLENQSVHMVAFTTKEAYPYQAGTGLIDAWFEDSWKRGITHISFDQLRQKYGPRDQKGSSEFKENFIEYRMHFPKAYIRFF